MVIVSKKLVPKGFASITIFPFIFVATKKLKDNKILINHEKIHLRQQLELLIIPFYIWYGISYAIGLLKGKNKREAYRNIIFEREAYTEQANLEYLKHRKLFRFLKY